MVLQSLNPAEALQLINRNQWIEIKSHDLSRALNPFVKEESEEWLSEVKDRWSCKERRDRHNIQPMIANTLD